MSDRSGTDLVKMMVWSAAAVVLSATVMLGVNKLDQVVTDVAIIKTKMDTFLIHEVERVREELKRQQREIDRIEGVLPEVIGKALPPYSFTPNGGETNG